MNEYKKFASPAFDGKVVEVRSTSNDTHNALKKKLGEDYYEKIIMKKLL